jgi:archaeosortase C (PEF-CTERM variant)
MDGPPARAAAAGAAPPTPGDPPGTSGGSGGEGPGRRAGGLRPLVGLMLAGYGVLVLAGVLPHDSPWAGAASLLAGAAVLAFGLPAVGAPRARVVAALGCACVGGVLGYALATRDGLGLAEAAIVAYGALLLLAAPNLDRAFGRFRVASAVGWSFPVALAPLSLFALNAALSSGETGTAATPIVEALVVAPTAVALRLLGTPVEQLGSTLLLATPRGTLSLGVGLVCAGLYPAVLFAGLVGLHAWRSRMRPGAIALVVAAGLVGLWLLNLFRLVILTHVGIRYGMAALQTAHANLGWILFCAFMAAFWWVVLRRAEPSAGALPAATGGPGEHQRSP